MAGNALPILLIGGAALLAMGGKKKKKKPEEEGPLTQQTVVGTAVFEKSLALKCEEFIDAVWVESQGSELPIKEFVVEETILPSMRKAARNMRKQKGSDLTTDARNGLIQVGLNAVAPNCGWVLTSLGWRYADNRTFEGKILDVFEGMEEIALSVIEEVNAAKTLGEVTNEPEDEGGEPGGLSLKGG